MTMFAINVRCSPCSERFERVSSARVDVQRVAVALDRDVADEAVLELALRALHADRGPSIVTSTPLGTVIGCFPIRDMTQLRYQTWHRTSPPTWRSRASRSVSRP